MTNILPSMQSSSSQEFNLMLDRIISNFDQYKQLSNQGYLALHLDFVFTNFAQTRNAVITPDVNAIFIELMKFTETSRIASDFLLNTHLMGDTADLDIAYEQLMSLPKLDNAFMIIYFPESYLINKDVTSLVAKHSCKIGVWYDLGEWENKDFVTLPQSSEVLLMTVNAGSPGQTKSVESESKAIQTAQNHPEHNFVLDGGWDINIDLEQDNVEVVSKTSFWNSFNQLIPRQ